MISVLSLFCLCGRGSPLSSRACGTGFVVTDDGYILTNEHVIRDATTIVVTLEDREFPAQVVSASQADDLALLKIDVRGQCAVRIGDPGAVQLLDSVIAMGFPAALELGHDLTVTDGKVTSIKTAMPGHEGQRIFQTDAAIYHGSSGGPLFDVSGNVIGINYAVLEGAEFYYAISISEAFPLLREIPGFFPLEPGDPQEEISSRDIIRKYQDAVAYIETSIETPVQAYLPADIAGYDNVETTAWERPTAPPALDLPTSLPLLNTPLQSIDPLGSAGQIGLRPGDMLFYNPCNLGGGLGSVSGRLGVTPLSYAFIEGDKAPSVGGEYEAQTLIAVCSSDEEAEQAAEAMIQSDTDGMDIVSRGSFSTSTLKLSYAVGFDADGWTPTRVVYGYSDDADDPIQLAAHVEWQHREITGHSYGARLRGTATVGIGSLVLSCTLSWRETHFWDEDDHPGLSCLLWKGQEHNEPEFYLDGSCVFYHCKTSYTNETGREGQGPWKTTKYLCVDSFVNELQDRVNEALNALANPKTS